MGTDGYGWAIARQSRTTTEVLLSFFQKRRSSRDNGAARQFIFFAQLSFLQKKAGLTKVLFRGILCAKEKLIYAL